MLRSFAERTFRVAFEQLNDPVRFEKYCEDAFSSTRFRLEMEDPASEFWLGWEGDTLASYLKLSFYEHPADLNSTHTVKVERLYVEPTLQNRKIGEKMLDFAQQQAKLRQSDWIWLSVWQATPAALRFYERCGYEIFGTETFWLADEAQLDWLVKLKVGK